MSRFEALGSFIYENGNRIGCTVEEGAGEIARKLNAYQMRVERLKAMPHDDDTCPHLVVLGRLKAENARLKAEVDRLKLDYYENKTGEVSATIVQTFNTETGEADYVVSLDDYKKMADMFNAEFLRLKAEVERLRASSFVTAVPVEHYEAQRHRIEALREAGDGLWYCLRHRDAVSPEERNDYIMEWTETRDGIKDDRV